MDQLRRSFTLTLIKKADDELNIYCQQINNLSAIIRKIREELSRVLFADHNLTNEESQIIEVIHKQEEIDLTDLFVALHRKGRKIELGELLSKLESLYRKNRVIIRVQRRG